MYKSHQDRARGNSSHILCLRIHCSKSATEENMKGAERGPKGRAISRVPDKFSRQGVDKEFQWVNPTASTTLLSIFY